MIYLGTDHAGFELKEEITKYLQEQGKEIEDLGAFELNLDDDYPDFVGPVAEKVALRQASASAKATADKQGVFGIVFGGSGQGEAIVANRFKGVRAAVYYGGNLDIVKLSRQHNNANILSLGARFLTKEQALEAVKLWLETPFEGGRHQRRIEKTDQ
jgi:ribose 5-phosphate isomerase B